jgi:hypothetical protein
LSEAKHLGFIAVGIEEKSPEIFRFAQNDNLQIAWKQMTNGEDNATDRMTTRSRTSVVQLQQGIHDALRVQHPDWIEPSGDYPTCESHESRLAKLLGFASSGDTR